MNSNQENSARFAGRYQFAIFILALIPRWIYAYINDGVVVGDGAYYQQIADNLLAGKGFGVDGVPTAFVSPLFPILFAICKYTSDNQMIWLSFFEGVISSIACVLIAKTAFRLFGSFTGLLAGVIAALYFELILWGSITILTEPLYTSTFAAAIYLLIKALTTDKNNFASFCWGGFFFGLAGLTRPLGLLTAIVTAISIAVISSIRHDPNIKRPLIFLAICLLTMLPWGIRNYFTMDHFTLLSTEGGHVFWLGNNPEYDKFDHPDMSRFGGYTTMFYPFPDEVNNKNEVEGSQIFYEVAWKHIFAHPLNFIKRGFHKTWNMWRPAFSGSSSRNLLISFTLYPVLLIFSLIGIFFAAHLNLPSGAKTGVYLLMAIFAFNLSLHFLITGEIRFRVPLWVILIPFAALTLKTILERVGFNHSFGEA